MNIFVLDTDPFKAAKMHCDKHVVKLILEASELLAIGLARNFAPQDRYAHYAWKHYWNHPCSKWAGASYANWMWLRSYAIGLCDEYTYRYGKVHKYDSVLKAPPAEFNWPSWNPTSFTQCMLPQYKGEDAITAYRQYYIGAKSHLLSYTKREIPYWLKEVGLGVQK